MFLLSCCRSSGGADQPLMLESVVRFLASFIVLEQDSEPQIDLMCVHVGEMLLWTKSVMAV